MSKRIIALYGHSNCGKSQTLNILKSILREKGSSLSTNLRLTPDERETFCYNDKIICITPAGDDAATIQRNIEYFENHNADILVTSSRSKGATRDILDDYAHSQCIKVEWKIKSVEYYLSKDIQQLCNKKVAELLFEFL